MSLWPATSSPDGFDRRLIDAFAARGRNQFRCRFAQDLLAGYGLLVRLHKTRHAHQNEQEHDPGDDGDDLRVDRFAERGLDEQHGWAR